MKPASILEDHLDFWTGEAERAAARLRACAPAEEGAHRTRRARAEAVVTALAAYGAAAQEGRT